MTLKTAKNIETICLWITAFIVLPVVLISIILEPLQWFLNTIERKREWILKKIGNKLMHMSDAVKDGTIKNNYCLRQYTARMAWKHLKQAKESEKEAEI